MAVGGKIGPIIHTVADVVTASQKRPNVVKKLKNIIKSHFLKMFLALKADSNRIL